MRQTIIIFITSILLFSCSTNLGKKEITYFVIKHSKFEKPDYNSTEPPPPILLNLDRTNEGCVVLRKATQLGNKKAFEYISEG